MELHVHGACLLICWFVGLLVMLKELLGAIIPSKREGYIGCYMLIARPV